jgi:hypothetical protein
MERNRATISSGFLGTWVGKGDITSLDGKDIRIEVILENASIFLYSPR